MNSDRFLLPSWLSSVSHLNGIGEFLVAMQRKFNKGDYLLRFIFNETAGLSRAAEPVRFGVPIVAGQLENPELLRILDIATSEIIPGSVIEIKRDRAGVSCDWLDVSFCVSIHSGRAKEFALVKIESAVPELPCKSMLEFELADGTLLLQSKDREFQGKIFASIEGVASENLYFNASKTLYDNSNLNSRVLGLRLGVQSNDKKLNSLELDLHLTNYYSSGLIDLDLTLTNREAAVHERGLWDLGDENSVSILSFSLNIEHVGAEACFVELESENGWRIHRYERSIRLLQLSSGVNSFSGGSDFHGNVDGVACIEGFELGVDNCSILKGKRASFVSHVQSGGASLKIFARDFWETCPSSFVSNSSHSEIGLLAKADGIVHELQPGESISKTVSIQVDHTDISKGERSYLGHRLSPPNIREGVLVLSECIFNARLLAESAFERSLKELIVSPDVFYEKREMIDEYGWRNYGDVFADHESLYVAKNSQLLVSHYNNQYDLVLGFGLQFMRTGEKKWYYLMEDLARHVCNIDIYRTEKDRVEYNGGLFWHTNHYQSAATATHRTFSIFNYDEAKPYGSSGGPSPEHCYTTGLALHYFMTSNQKSKDSVLLLANWVSGYLDQDYCLMACAHSAATRELKNIFRLIRRQPVERYHYPFTRASGNYLNACLDAYALDGSDSWLAKADSLVLNTFHANDNIELRNLQDVESTWFHTIFLQSVVRYLIVKEKVGELDVSYAHSVKAFLHYSHWMLLNISPYLENPEILEFGNDTWVAQDIRRHGLFVSAAALDPDNSHSFHEKADEFSNHIIRRLKGSDTLEFTRIQAIIMQNLCLAVPGESSNIFTSRCQIPPLKTVTLFGELLGICKKLFMGFKRFQWNAEKKWILSRIAGR